MLLRAFCDCALTDSYKPSLINLTKIFQEETENLINSGQYDTNDDFTVVLQPFMKFMRPPQKVISLKLCWNINFLYKLLSLPFFSQIFNSLISN